jgi:chemotaxis protein CheZ
LRLFQAVHEAFTPFRLNNKNIKSEHMTMSKSSALSFKNLPSPDERLARLAAAHGDMIATRDIVEVVESMVSTLRSEVEVATVRIGDELRDMINFIDTAKSEIASIKPSALANFDIPGATDQLDAVIAHTEQAAGQIMDCADELMALSSDADQTTSARLQEIATRIYEASSFQDITGQRVTKVVRVLKIVEDRLSALADVIGDTASAQQQDVERDTAGMPVHDKDLLNGPQLAGVGNNQDDIDALLASFD